LPNCGWRLAWEPLGDLASRNPSRPGAAYFNNPVMRRKPFFNNFSKNLKNYAENVLMDYQNIQKNLVDWLVLHRNLKGLTQVQLSRLLEKNQSFVSKYENYERNLVITEFLEICVALDCDPTVKLQGEMNAIKIKRSD
jgi:hypothetical protein